MTGSRVAPCNSRPCSFYLSAFVPNKKRGCPRDEALERHTTHARMHAHTCSFTRTHTHPYSLMHAHTRAHSHTRIHARIRTHSHTCMRTRSFAHVHAHVHTCSFTHARARTCVRLVRVQRLLSIHCVTSVAEVSTILLTYFVVFREPCSSRSRE